MLVAVALTVITAGVASVLLKSDDPVVVPSVEGLQDSTARSRLASLGLGMEIGDRRFSIHQPEGYVVSQYPSPGTKVAAGEVVNVVVSTGDDEVTVPDVVGLRFIAASGAIENLGLRVDVRPILSTESSDTVIGVAPAPGTSVSVGSMVLLSVSAGTSDDALLPTDMSGCRFVLDPGPLSTGVSDLTMEVGRTLSALLQASGAEVVMTRSIIDTDLPVSTRVVRASQESSITALIGISLSTDGQGMGVSYLASDPEHSSIFIGSVTLARVVAARLRSSIGPTVEDSVETDQVLQAVPECISIRVFVGDPDSVASSEKMTQLGWAESIARAIYRALAQDFGSS